MNRTALIILGSHRSGTSAITRTTNLLGAFLPEKLYSSNYGNAKGHWESQSVLDINEEILRDLSSSHDDILKLDKNWFESSKVSLFQKRIADFLGSEIGDATFPVIKDPRLCLLFPIWEKVLVHTGFEIKIVLPFRNPLEVAHSFKKRNTWPIEKGLILWLKHVINAEFYSRNYQRIFVSYPDFLDNWQLECDRIANRLDITWPQRNNPTTAEAIDDFLDKKLRHHNLALDTLSQSTKANKFIRKVYSTLCDSALCTSTRDNVTLDTSKWEEIYEEWQFLEENSQNILFAYQQKINETNLKEEQLKLKEEQLRLKEENLKNIREENLEKTYHINSLIRELSDQALQHKALLSFIDRQIKKPSWKLFPKDILRLPNWIKNGGFKAELRFRKYVELIEISGLFDESFYLKQNPEVADSSLSPLLHYLKFGASEQRDPSPLFSTSRYLEANPDVLETGVNPLLHYILFGLFENRKLSPTNMDDLQPLRPLGVTTDKPHLATKDLTGDVTHQPLGVDQ